MADILVTVPKTSVDTFFEEAEYCSERNLDFNWLLLRKPKRLSVGEYIYFLVDNEIQYRMKIKKLIPDFEFTCETTGKVWGKRFSIQGDAPEPVEVYPESIKSFMSFHYLESHPGVAEFYQKSEEEGRK